MLVSLETTTGAVLRNGAPVESLSFRKGNVIPFRVQMLRDSAPFHPPEEWDIGAKVNALGTFGGPGYATSQYMGVEGTGDEAVCIIRLDFTGSALTNAFSGDAPAVSAHFELSWSEGDYFLTSDIVPAIIRQTLRP
jgi:hypothetical protein